MFSFQGGGRVLAQGKRSETWFCTNPVLHVMTETMFSLMDCLSWWGSSAPSSLSSCKSTAPGTFACALVDPASGQRGGRKENRTRLVPLFLDGVLQQDGGTMLDVLPHLDEQDKDKAMRRRNNQPTRE